MKILFVYPGISNIGFNAFELKPQSVDSWYIPISLCYLAATVIKDGHEVDILDLRFMANYEEAKQKILESGCDMVAITFQTPAVPFAFEVAKIAKELGKIVVGGGIHTTIFPKQTMETGFFDYLVAGEGCISFSKLVNSLERGESCHRIIYGERVEQLETIPFPYYFDLYVDKVILPRKLVMMFGSRGCPGKCTFCQPVAEKMFGRKVYFRSADNILEEVLHWKKKYDIDTFMMVDDTFMMKKKLVREFCEKLISYNTGLSWSCNARVNEFDDDTVRLLAKSNCRSICIGFESGSQHILDITKKYTTVEQGYFAAELCYKYDIDFTTNILVGIPGETDADYQLNYDFVKKINAKRIVYNFLVPYPGTDIYQECVDNGWIDQNISWDGYEMNRVQREGIINCIDYDRVKYWHKKIVNWAGEFLALIKEGNTLEGKGELDKAYICYEKILKEYPKRYQGHLFCGKIFKRKHDYAKAIDYLEKAIDLMQKERAEDGRFFEKNDLCAAYFHLGEVYLSLENSYKARDCFENCLDLNPFHKGSQGYLDTLLDTVKT